jgi:hypothetical protein
MPNLFRHPTGQVADMHFVDQASGILKQVTHDMFINWLIFKHVIAPLEAADFKTQDDGRRRVYKQKTAIVFHYGGFRNARLSNLTSNISHLNLDDQHGIAVAVETVFFFYSNFVCVHYVFIAAKCRDHH